MVTKHAGVTKHSGMASNFDMVTKRAGVTKCAATDPLRHNLRPKLQALVYNLPSTTAIFSYIIGS